MRSLLPNKLRCLLEFKSELTGVSLASHAARVASFVHCRTRGCEAIFSTLYSLQFFFFFLISLMRRFSSICLPLFISSLSLRDRSTSIFYGLERVWKIEDDC